jgi:hypothetical protein
VGQRLERRPRRRSNTTLSKEYLCNWHISFGKHRKELLFIVGTNFLLFCQSLLFACRYSAAVSIITSFFAIFLLNLDCSVKI